MNEDHRSNKRNYWIAAGAIVFALLLGMGAGIAVAGDSETEADVPNAVEQLHSDWYSAWNDADGTAVVSMMAPAGRHYCLATGNDGASGQELADYVDGGLAITDVEMAGVFTLNTPGTGDGSSQDHIVVTTLTVDGHPNYVSVLHLRGPDDDLEVLSHRAFQ